jgi:hypothetical protein
VVRGLTLVDVVGQSVGTDGTLEVGVRLYTISRGLVSRLLTILGTVLGRPSASFSPDFVPAPE